MSGYPGRAASTTLPYPYDNLPQVYPMHSASDVLHSLNQPQAWNDKIYAFAVLNSYLKIKQYRGKSNFELNDKLQYIEGQLPAKFGAVCIEIRKVYRLPPSRVFKLVPRDQAPPQDQHRTAFNGTQYPANVRGPILRDNTIPRQRITPIVPRPTATAPAPAPARPRDPEAGEDLPPPPYAAEDPDPEATRLLQERLAADASVSEDAPPAHRRTMSTTSSHFGDAPRPSDFPASPAARAGSIHEASSISDVGRPSSIQEAPRVESIPEAAPSDPEEAERRAREESELEEALRVSRAAEAERLEMEAAVKASIASAEEDARRRSAYNEASGAAGPSSQQSEFFNAHSGPSADANNGGGSQEQGYTQGFNSVHGGYSASPSMPTAGTGNMGYNPQVPQQTGGVQSDIDMLGDLDFNNNALPAPLQPVPTGLTTQPLQPVPTGLTAQSTGGTKPNNHLKSRNPFLSVEEREAQQAAEDEAEAGSASPSLSSHSHAPSHRSQAPDRELPPLPPRTGTGDSLGPDPPSLASLGLEPQQQVPALAVEPPSRSNTMDPYQQANAVDGSAPPSPQSNMSSSPPSSFAGWKNPPPLPPGHPGMTDRRVSRPLPQPMGAPYSGPPVIPPSHSTWDQNAARSLSSRFSGMSVGDRQSNYTPHGALNSPPIDSLGTPSSNPSASSSTHAMGVPTTPTRARSPAPIIDNTGESILEMLRNYSTVFLIDDSSSMAGERWEQAQAALRGVVNQAIRYDDDGVDIYFLNSKRVGKGLRTSADVEELFAGLDPRGATPTGLRMESILRDYMARLEASADGPPVRSMNLIIVTDGAFAKPLLDRRIDPTLPAPTDDPESVIISIARRLDRGDYPLSQVGIQLLQIGDDAEASEALRELDDGLAQAHGVRDMVDTVPYRGEAITGDLIVKVLLGGINRRLDRKP